MTQDMPRLGFVGLDPVGRAIVQRLRGQGYDVLIADPRRDVVEALESAGAVAMPTPLLVAEASDVLITRLDGDTALFELFVGPEGALERLRPGSTIIDLTSATPMTIQQIAADAALRGILVVDAPINGSPVSAQRGELTMMVGAAPEVFEEVLPLLQVVARWIVRVGDPGMGKLVKLISQLVTGVSLVLYGEALALAGRAGANLEAVLEVIQASARGGSLWDETASYLLRGAPVPEQETLEQVRRDVERVLRLGADLDCPIPLSAIAYQFYVAARTPTAHLAPAADVARAVARFAGVQLPRQS